MKKKPNEKVLPEVQQWFGTTFTNNKAGMAEVDKDKVKRVVYDMSKVRHITHSGDSKSQPASAPLPMHEGMYHTAADALFLAFTRAGHSALQAWTQASGPDRGQDQEDEAAGAETEARRASEPHKVTPVLPCTQAPADRACVVRDALYGWACRCA